VKYLRQVSAAMFCVVVSGGSLAQSNVPIDSPRGNYEGAENIHWYQQNSLKEEDWGGLPSPSGYYYECNKDDDLSLDCWGDEMKNPQKSYYAMGRVPIKVAVFVDTRETDGFSYRWRRAIDAIRRTNDALARSGVGAILVVSHIQDFDFDAKGYSFDLAEISERIGDQDRDFYTSTAKETGADVLMFVRNKEGHLEDGDPIGKASLGLNEPYKHLTPRVLLACENDECFERYAFASTVAPHEFGHAFGLMHQPDKEGDTAEPHLAYGYGFVHSSGMASIMATGDSKIKKRIPVYSSPSMFWRDDDGDPVAMGKSDESDAARALRHAVTNAALYWERRYGTLQNKSSSSTTSGAALKKRAPPGDLPGIMVE